MSRCLFACVLMLLVPAMSVAAPFVEVMDPPALTRGATNRVTFTGTELEQAIGVWSSSPGGSWSVKPTSDSRTTQAAFEITVPSDAPLGLIGLRVVTKSGFSNVHLILIDELPVTTRPTNADEQPVDVVLPACVAASCRGTKTDRYAINVQAGQRVGFDLIGSRLGKDFDPLVTIRDSAGRAIAMHDNDVGLFFDCRFAHTFEAAGRYSVEVRDSRFEGNPLWRYLLRMGDFPAARVTLPSAISLGVEQRLMLPELKTYAAPFTVPATQRLRSFVQEIRSTPTGLATWLPLATTSLENRLEVEPNNSLETATPVVVPGMLNGVLSQRGDQDVFALELKKGQVLQFEGSTRELGSPADLELVLFDDKGKEVRRVDDVSQQRNGVAVSYEARFDFNVGQDGAFKLLVRDMSNDGGGAFAYRIEVAEPQPELELLAEYSSFTVPQKSWQPLPISVTRTRITGPVELELIGAPAGVTLEPRTIPADANDIVCRLIANEAAVESISVIQIVGKCQSADGKLSTESLVRSAPLIDRQLRNKDRQPYSLRDNQVQLPPSLPERLALQITPPAPFSVDLPFAELLNTKYLQTGFPIETTRVPGFQSPISFSVSGGQIGTEAEERDNVFAVIPDATSSQLTVEGQFFNRINTRYEKKRADLVATAEFEGHRISFMRTFSLDVRSAFKPTFEPATLMIEPGKSAKVKLLANRTTTYTGEVILKMQQPQLGLSLPEEIVIPAGKSEIELEIGIAADQSPRRFSPRFQSTGYVGKYEEELNEPTLNIDVVKPKP